MQKTGKTALARYSARGKQHLVQVRCMEGGLVLQQLLYADEVRPFAEVPREEGEVKEPELNLAVQIVEQIATDTFRPELYKDEVRGRILAEIEKKVAGQEITMAEPAEQPGAQIVDLMEALKASIAASSAKKAGNEAPAAPPALRAVPAAEEDEAPARKPAKRAPRAAAQEKKATKK
jgi:DNA end-binding protein Ku